jgi:hypothetical protein
MLIFMKVWIAGTHGTKMRIKTVDVKMYVDNL